MSKYSFFYVTDEINGCLFLGKPDKADRNTLLKKCTYVNRLITEYIYEQENFGLTIFTQSIFSINGVLYKKKITICHFLKNASTLYFIMRQLYIVVKLTLCSFYGSCLSFGVGFSVACLVVFFLL